MNWLRNLSLGIKINLTIVLSMVVIGTAILGIEIASTNTLVEEIGQFRIEQEVVLIERLFIQGQEELETAATLFANTPGLVEAVATNNESAIRALVLSAVPALNIDNFDIINAEGARLIDTDIEFEESEIIAQALLGIQRTTLLQEHRDSEVSLQVVSIRPLRDDTGTIQGGILLSREIHAEFLNVLNAQRQGVELALVVDNQIIEKSSAISEDEGDDHTNEILTSHPGLFAAALAGETVINPETVYSAAGVPHTEGYIPLRGLDDRRAAAALAIWVDNEAIAVFQRNLTTNSAAILVVIAVTIIAAVIAIVRWTVSQRVNQLQHTASVVAQGNYAERVNITGQDEVGKLAQAFNQMAEAVEYRDRLQEQQLLETQAARERAERSDQVKSAFLASMSHELRTPLNAVINFTRFVVDGDVGTINNEQSELLNGVIDSAKHLLNLINDVLDMSKIEAGSLNLFVEDNIDMDGLLNQVVRTGYSLLGDKSIRIHTDIDAALPALRGDRQRLLQIFLNIMSNACKFTEAGEIHVTAHLADDEVIISITDTGPGIAPEDQDAVFEPFKQTRAGLRQGGGTGLGMPIAKNLAEAHGGRLWLESEPGEGSTFSVALPVHAEAMLAEPVRS